MKPLNRLLGAASACLILLSATAPVGAAAAQSLTELIESLVQHPADRALRARIERQILVRDEPSDDALLVATPLSRARMDLIWLDPTKLRDLAASVRAAGGHVTATYYDSADNDLREHEVDSADVRWAQRIEKLIDFAYAAGREERFQDAVLLYKQALILAPGGDLFLMSVGVSYVQLGQKDRGLRYLERAAELSPNNGRIRRNLDSARSR